MYIYVYIYIYILSFVVVVGGGHQRLQDQRWYRRPDNSLVYITAHAIKDFSVRRFESQMVEGPPLPPPWGRGPSAVGPGGEEGEGLNWGGDTHTTTRQSPNRLDKNPTDYSKTRDIQQSPN